MLGGGAARAAFNASDLMRDADAGDYILGGDLTARIADEDGDYPNDSTRSLELDGDSAAQALANPGVVVLLDSGANG